MESFVSAPIIDVDNPIQEAYDSLSPVLDDSTGFPKVPEKYFWRVKQDINDEHFVELQLVEKTFFREKVKKKEVIFLSGIEYSKERFIDVSEELYKLEFGRTFIESLIGDYPEKKLPDFEHVESFVSICGDEYEYDSQTGLPKVDEDMHWSLTNNFGFLDVQLMHNKKVVEYIPTNLDKVILRPSGIYHTAAFCLSKYKKNSFRRSSKVDLSEVTNEHVGDYPPKTLW